MDEREWVAELCDRVVREVRETLQGQHAELLRELSEMTREGKVVRLMEPPRNELVVLPHQVQEPEARKSPQRGRPKSIQSARSGASEERGQVFDACVPVAPQPMNAAARAIMKKKREEGRPRNAYRKLSAHQMAALPRLQLAHMRLRQLLSTTFFEIISMLLIVSNVVFCGIEAEILSQNPERAVEVGLDVVSITYNVVFLIEFLLLVIGHGVIEHFTSAEWAWHLFDAVVVFFGVVEVVLFTLQQGGNFSAEYVRVVRLVKIFRVLRVVRVMRSLRGLRLLLLSLVHTIRSLIWTLSLLLVILWFFGIVFTTAANQQATMPNATEQEKLDKYFGSLWRTVFTLFKCSCNGMDWFEAEEVLEHLDQAWIWVGFFLLYICFTYFALLNIITGVFCHSAITGAFKNEDVVADELLVHKGLQGRRLLEIWDRMDYEGFGSLDESRFIEAFDDEQVALGLEVLGIKVTSPKEFFDFLAAESEMRMVFPERFVDVGLSLQGEAKALEVALMRQAMGLPGLAIRSSRNVENEVSHEVSGARPEG